MHRTTRYTYAQTGRRRWTATVASRLGPLSARGHTLEEARAALEQIVAIARAIEVTLHRGAGAASVAPALQ